MIVPNKNLQTIWPQLPSGGEVLDLGFGFGRDAIFLTEKGYNVTAIDISSDRCEKLSEIVLQRKLQNIQIVCQDIKDFEIEKEKYTLINAINVIQFLEKGTGLEVIQKIKNGVVKNGCIIISVFTKQDPEFSKRLQNCVFDKDELKNLFSDFEIISYEEKVIDEPGHPGYEEPHQHGIANIVAKKQVN